MNYTENYELPLIEGTDVIDYAPYNESMNKVDTALNDMGDDVQEAKDDVAEMGDTLNQKVQEVNEALEQTESDVNEALQQTESNVNTSLQQTTDELTGMVNSKLSRISKFVIAKTYEIPEDTYYYGSESGILVAPLTSLTPKLSRVDEIATGQMSNNSFPTVPTVSASSRPVCKIDFDIEVEPTSLSESYNGACNTTLQLFYNSGAGGVLVDEIEINTSRRTPIHYSNLVTSSANGKFFFRLNSNYAHKVVGLMKLTVEDIGMDV